MVRLWLDHKKDLIWWSWSRYISWSRDLDPDDFMINLPIFQDLVIAEAIFFVMNFVFIHCFLLIHFNPKLYRISIYAFMSVRTVVINRNSPIPWLKLNFSTLDFWHYAYQNALMEGTLFICAEQIAPLIKDWPADLWG